MKNKNIIVTGGLGFIGSHIVEELINANQITIIDNKSSGKIENLANPNHENLKIITEDLTTINLDDLTLILKDVDYVFHLAALASVPMSVKNPIKSNENNVDATVKLLNASKDSEISKFVFSSSSAVYGENPNMPLSESELLMPTSPHMLHQKHLVNYIASLFLKVMGYQLSL